MQSGVNKFKNRNLSLTEELGRISGNIKDNPATSTGVYVILSKVNDMIFVGSTTKSFSSRWAEHLYELEHNRHKIWTLQYLYHIHGADNFAFYMIEVCPISKCIIRENFYYNDFQPELNTGGGGGKLGLGHSSSIELENVLEGWILTPKAREYLKNIMTTGGVSNPEINLRITPPMTKAETAEQKRLNKEIEKEKGENCAQIIVVILVIPFVAFAAWAFDLGFWGALLMGLFLIGIAFSGGNK